MLSAEKECCLVPLYLQDCCLGSLEVSRMPEHPLDALCCFPPCRGDGSTEVSHREMHKTQKCQVLKGYT